MKRITFIAAIVFLISSCSTITPETPTPQQQKLTWQTRQQILAQIQSWRLNGKIAVRTAQDSGSASINWQQRGKNFDIALLGPLGAGGMNLSGQPGNVRLKAADGNQFSASSAEELLSKQWGFNLPVSSLRYWVRGLPVPGASHQDKFDQYHRLESFSQQGFRISYLAYTRTSKIDLPAKMVISSPALTTKIIVYKWNI